MTPALDRLESYCARLKCENEELLAELSAAQAQLAELKDTPPNEALRSLVRRELGRLMIARTKTRTGTFSDKTMNAVMEDSITRIETYLKAVK